MSSKKRSSPATLEEHSGLTDFGAAGLGIIATLLVLISVAGFFSICHELFHNPLKLFLYCFVWLTFAILWMAFVVCSSYWERVIDGAFGKGRANQPISQFAPMRLLAGAFINFYAVGVVITVTGGPTVSPFSSYGVAMLVIACMIAHRPHRVRLLFFLGVLFYLLLAFAPIVWEFLPERIFPYFNDEFPLGDTPTKYFADPSQVLSDRPLQITGVAVILIILAISILFTRMREGLRPIRFLRQHLRLCRHRFSKLVSVAKHAGFPLAILLLMIGGTTAAALGFLPNPAEWGNELTGIFLTYGVSVLGLGLIAVVAWSENIVGVNVYLPFSIVILAAMAMTGGDPDAAIRVFLVIYLFSMLGLQTNYWVVKHAKHGLEKWISKWQRSKKQELTRTAELVGEPKWKTFAFTMWHPHLAAITCARCGEVRMPYLRFALLLLLWLTPWHLFWGYTMYNYGVWLGQGGYTLIVLAYAYVVGLVVVRMYRGFMDMK